MQNRLLKSDVEINLDLALQNALLVDFHGPEEALKTHCEIRRVNDPKRSFS
jgi:hypothetical protein